MRHLRPRRAHDTYRTMRGRSPHGARPSQRKRTTMPTITLPNGAQKSFDTPPTGLDVARSIGPRLERDAVAVRVDGVLRDLSLPITADAAVEIVTRESPEGLELLRHDAAHALAEAVKELYPETQVTIGPAID